VDATPPKEWGKTLCGGGDRDAAPVDHTRGDLRRIVRAFGRVRSARRFRQRVSRGRNELDAFVLERLHEEKLVPSPEAERHTLLRRFEF